MTEEEKRKFLFRFLKEKGVYRKFLKYISDKRYHNLQHTVLGRNNFPIDWCISYWGLNNIISSLIIWDATKEGYLFWLELCKEFDMQLRNKMKENGNKFPY